jgi:hypothetical protein
MIRFQLSSTLSPSGLAVPNPVTTTLLFGMVHPFFLEQPQNRFHREDAEGAKNGERQFKKPNNTI